MYVWSMALDGRDFDCPSTRPQRRAMALVAVLALLLFAMSRMGTIQLGVPAPGGSATAAGDPASYQATYDGDGFAFLSSGSAVPLSVALTSLDRGGHRLPVDPGGWSAGANVNERSLSRTVTERVTERADEVEWDVLLSEAPAGRGDLVVRASLDGVVGPVSTERGDDGTSVLRVPTAGGSVDIGEVVVLDATGAELHRALPTVRDGGIELRVPDAVLEGAKYPVTIDPTVTSTTVVSTGGQRSYPSMASDGNQYLVVWQQTSGTLFLDIWGARVSADGVGVGAAFRISQSTRTEQYPDVAWNGSSFLVVWEDAYNVSAGDYDIRGRRVDAAGNLIGSEIGISTPSKLQGNPAVAAGSGGQFLVAWNDNRNGPVETYSARLNANGAVLDSGGVRLQDRATDAAYTDLRPDVAWNGSVYLVVWQQKFAASNGTGWLIMARYVHPDGTLSDGENSVGGNYDGVLYDDPAVASSGSDFFVAYEAGSDIRGSVVESDWQLYPLSFDSQLPISTASDVQSDPAVAYNGDYLVVWRDRRAPPDPDVYATRVKADGTVLDANGFSIVASSQHEDTPAVAKANGAFRWGVSYESGLDSAQNIHLRVAAK